MLMIPVLRTRIDWLPSFASEALVPTSASASVHDPVEKVTVPAAYAGLLPVSRFSKRDTSIVNYPESQAGHRFDVI